jgi:hypothetical protein
MEIRDRELYKFKNGGEYGTFEAYCKGVWDFARRTAYQFIDSVQVMENVRHGAQIEILPANERQTRPLIKLSKEPEKQREAWQKAAYLTRKRLLRLFVIRWEFARIRQEKWFAPVLAYIFMRYEYC